LTGDGLDYLNLALKDGGVTLTMNLGNGRLEMQIKPNRVRFDDNQWHKVTVHRKVQEVRESCMSQFYWLMNFNPDIRERAILYPSWRSVCMCAQRCGKHASSKIEWLRFLHGPCQGVILKTFGVTV
jgi:hypothetical protein